MSILTKNDSHRYLILIGSEYCPALKIPSLERVNSDIENIKKIFSDEMQGYTLPLEEMINWRSTDIITTLKNFFSPGKLSSSDNVIVYYSGHGDTDGAFKDHYLFTLDSRSNNIAGTAIKTEALVECFFENFENGAFPNVLLVRSRVKTTAF